MPIEIELKARITKEDSEKLFNILKEDKNVTFLGQTDKQDIYWSCNDDDIPLFRTRYEKSEIGNTVYFTSKPSKTKSDNIEFNKEIEFTAPISEWDNVLNFCKSINLRIIRRKYKKGFHCIYHGKFDIHVEVLEVKYLGWFIESEIIIDSEDDEEMKKEAKNTLFDLLKLYSIPLDSIEPKGYNKLLKEIGHEEG